LKLIGRIAKWTAVSIIFQLVILSYFNFIYLPKRNEVDVVILEPQEEKVGNRRIPLPRDASQIKASHNGRYAAYLYKDQLRIVDTKNKKIIKKLSSEGNGFSYYRWLQDRNMIIYSPRKSAADSNLIEISTYNVDWDILRNYPVIETMKKDSEVTSIELSPLTNMVYIKVETSTNASIYKFDIMDNLNFIMNIDKSTVMKKSFFNDILILQDKDYNLYIWNGKEKHILDIPTTNRVILLGIAGEDKVFLGELDKLEKIQRLLAGKIISNTNINWQEIEIELVLDPKNIYVFQTEEVFIVEKDNNIVYSLMENSRHLYRGEFIEFLDKHIVSRDGRYLILQEIV
jgi:hypothetical protein